MTIPIVLPVLKRTLLLCSFVAIAGKCVSQVPSNLFDIKTTLPTSPEAAMIGKFGGIPIGYYTGTADISIPFYTIKEAGIEIPITLRYHGSGIKVEDQASSVGLGWSLDPGGSIIQVINGKKDSYDQLTLAPGYQFLKDNIPVTGVQASRPEIGRKVFPCIPFDSKSVGDDQLTLDYLQQGHGQPDIYMYNFPGGYSGRFYINPETKQIVLLDKKSDIKFEPDQGGGWRATTIDGNKFTFAATEFSYVSDSSDYAGFTWKLTQIDFNNGKTINFEYARGFSSWFSFSETYHSQYPLGMGSTAELFVQPYLQNNSSSTRLLSKIVTADMQVVFNMEDRDDMLGKADNDGDNSNGTMSVKRIKSVDMIARGTGNKIKSWVFSYNYFPYTVIGGDYTKGLTTQDILGKRLKLLSVKEVGYTNGVQSLEQPAYKFDYDETVTMPLKTSFARDYWGYYNGANNTKLIPDLTFFIQTGYYRWDMPTPSFLTTIDGANRAPDVTKMNAYLLKRITYPTGGYTTFDYEAHSFGHYNYPDANKITAVTKRVDISDYNETNDVKISQFKLSKTMPLTLKYNVSGGTSAQGLTFANLAPSKVTISKVVNGVSTVIRTWQMSTSDQAAFDASRNLSYQETVTFQYDPAISYYTIAVELPDVLGRQNDFNKGASIRAFFEYTDMPDLPTNISYGGGSRLATIRNYSQTGLLAGTRKLSYVNADGSTSGVILSKLSHVDVRSMYFETLPAGSQTAYGTTANIWFVSAENYVPFSNSAGGNAVAYSRVVETDVANDGSSNGSHVYYYHNKESSNSYGMPDDPDIANGSLEKEELFDAAGTRLSDVVYNYESSQTQLFTGFNCYKKFMIGYECRAAAPPGYTLGYIVLSYPLYTRWYQLKNKISSQYANGQVLTMNEDYAYNTKGQLISQASLNSKNEQVKTTYLYPIDATSNPSASALVSAGRYTKLLEQTGLVNNNETYKVRYAYGPSGNNYALSSIERSLKQGPFTQEVLFNSYGPYETLRETLSKGVTSSILWSDNNLYPIAKVENGSYATFSYTSFEPDASGRVNYSANGVNTQYSLTGKRSYDLASGNISVPLSSSGGTYVVSYWTKNAGPYTIAGTLAGYPVKGSTIDQWTHYEHRITGVGGFTISGTGYIDELKVYPLGAMMVSYTTEPLLGVTSETDIADRPTFYDFDPLGRLKVVRGMDGKILKVLDYQYQVPVTQ
ncbi:hypothetical protein [Chitinophaga sancti]|uniref:hypothetical protein n=1 Tax=Chitinophaga sancti TaxID=1004 RepID=UPI003F7A6750